MNQKTSLVLVKCSKCDGELVWTIPGSQVYCPKCHIWNKVEEKAG